MIRDPKSLFISIIVHAILIVVILFTWDKYAYAKKVKCSTTKECDQVPITLCNVAIKKKTQNREVKPKVQKKPVKKPEVKKVKVQKPKPEKKIVPIKKPEVTIVKFPKKTIKEPEIEKPVSKKEITQEKVEQKSQAMIDKERKLKQESLVEEYLKINTQEIAMLLQDNLYYPRSARKRNITGQITVKFTLGVDRSVSEVVVLKSNSEILSRAAIKTIQDLSGKFPQPQSSITLRVPIGYQLN
jgi:protein TonB